MSSITKDKRGRVWEKFRDDAYFGFWCVRWAENREFNSHTSFHFMSEEMAEAFVRLIKESS